MANLMTPDRPYRNKYKNVQSKFLNKMDYVSRSQVKEKNAMLIYDKDIEQYSDTKHR